MSPFYEAVPFNENIILQDFEMYVVHGLLIKYVNRFDEITCLSQQFWMFQHFQAVMITHLRIKQLIFWYFPAK